MRQTPLLYFFIMFSATVLSISKSCTFSTVFDNLIYCREKNVMKLTKTRNDAANIPHLKCRGDWVSATQKSCRRNIVAVVIRPLCDVLAMPIASSNISIQGLHTS